MSGAHDPRHPGVEYDPNELVRLGTVIDALHLADGRDDAQHPADVVLRLVAGREEHGRASGPRWTGSA